MSVSMEELSPSELGSKLVSLTVDDSQGDAVAGTPLSLTVDYSAIDEGVVLPLVLTVLGTTPSSYQTDTFTGEAPSSITITPREGGPHTIRLGEAAHNLYWGSITVDVDGDSLQQPEVI